MFIDAVFDRLSEVEQYEVKQIFKSNLFKSVIATYVDNLGGELARIDISKSDADIALKYRLIKVQFDMWMQYGQFVNSLLDADAAEKALTGQEE